MKDSKEGNDWFVSFQQGDKEAFRTVFDLHYRSVLYFAGSILQQDDFAEDIVSETFQKAWDNRLRFETPRHLENFLFFVTRNACISYLRSDKVYRQTRESWSRVTEGMDKADSAIDLEKVQTHLIARIHYHLAQMNGGEVIRMSYLEGKSTPEIARILNMTENNVYIIKSRTLKVLRELLAKENLSWLFLALLDRWL